MDQWAIKQSRILLQIASPVQSFPPVIEMLMFLRMCLRLVLCVCATSREFQYKKPCHATPVKDNFLAAIVRLAKFGCPIENTEKYIKQYLFRFTVACPGIIFFGGGGGCSTNSVQD
jgi:hypothetical protein